MKFKLVSIRSVNIQPLEAPVIAAIEAEFTELSERFREYSDKSFHASMVEFVKGELHGVKLAAHALGYKFEEDAS
ncbi:hypothetical protein [Terribacillus saccharophilus]|uniref:hypothetical protein n=1 Tax=Terribacillus saccharophilus TaxID=361277 RepID=UPI002DC4A266|nr:hypothetical protein [Terribacillus saccharophilus]MEC0288944.1 hypothetical protein [Terribacillus saccharophilus]